MWLTTPDRTALVAPQEPAALFPKAGQLPVLTVDDAQHSSRSMALALR